MIETFFSLLFVCFVIIPIIGFILILRYVIKKSSAKQKPEVLQKEKRQLFENVKKTKSKLIPWEDHFLVAISNKIDFNYIKGFTRKFNGIIMNSSGYPVIAFRRLDRGHNHTNSKIVATTSNNIFYFELLEKTIDIYKNDVFFGKIENFKTLTDANGLIIGELGPHDTNKSLYQIYFNTVKVAQMIKNTDRRSFLKNPFYDIRPTNPLEIGAFYEQDVSIENALLFIEKPITNNQYDWLLALVMFESAYYGIDFLQ